MKINKNKASNLIINISNNDKQIIIVAIIKIMDTTTIIKAITKEVTTIIVAIITTIITITTIIMTIIIETINLNLKKN